MLPIDSDFLGPALICRDVLSVYDRNEYHKGTALLFDGVIALSASWKVA